MSKRTKRRSSGASIGRGQSMHLTDRLPKVPQLPTLSPVAKHRLQVLEFAQRHGVRLAVEAYGVSRSTIYEWRKRYNPRKLESLEPKSRAPKRKRRVCWSWADEQAILKLRRQHPRWGKRKLAPLLQAAGHALSEATIGRILRRLKRSGRLIEPKRQIRRRSRPVRPHATRKPAAYQPQQPGDLVQIDTVHLHTTTGEQLRQFSAIDVVSRVAAVGVRTRATAGTAAAFVDELLDRFPTRIRAIQVDGGSEFMAEFEEICAANDIPVYVLPPRSPKLNGCVERFNRTSREEFWEWYEGAYDLASVQPALRAWEDEYNRLRPHQALQMQSPIAFLAATARTQKSSML